MYKEIYNKPMRAGIAGRKIMSGKNARKMSAIQCG